MLLNMKQIELFRIYPSLTRFDFYILYLLTFKCRVQLYITNKICEN